jgi:hypothetical protein
MKLEWAMAALVAGGGSGGGPPAAPAGNETVAVNYSRDVGWSGSEIIEVQRTGESTYLTSYNHDGKPEIGVWQHPVTEEAFEKLVAALDRSGYQHIASPRVVPPGTHSVVFGERKAGQAVPTMYSFVTVPAALAPVVTLIDATRASLRAHPLRVLRGEANWSAATVKRGDRLPIELRLTNIGRAELSLANPAAQTEGWNGLRVVLQPGAGGEARQVDLSSGDVSVAGNDRSPTLLLAPGQTIRFDLRPKLDVPPGGYASRIEYHSMGRHDRDARFVVGTLALPTGSLVVKRSWKLW